MAKLQLRKSSERGHADHGWLNSYHTFSFAGYHDPRHSQFGVLRVINEDRVAPGEGFGTHPHNDYEIFSYILDGQLEHKDSLGNKEVLEHGDVQFTSTGSGISHSEYNHSHERPVYFLQMWIRPDTRRLPPGYQTKTFPRESKLGKLCKILSPKALKDTSAIAINQDAHVFASILEKGQRVDYTFAPGRMGYLHLAMHNSRNGLTVNEVSLAGGDGLYIRDAGTLEVASVGDEPAEFILFDLPLER